MYTPEQFAALLRHADAHYRDLVPFLALAGFGMCRSAELINAYADRPTLRWENVIWERDIVSVPELVAKQTRRAVGNRREFPLNDALLHWLEAYRREEGPIVACPEAKWRSQLLSLFKETWGCVVWTTDSGRARSRTSLARIPGSRHARGSVRWQLRSDKPQLLPRIDHRNRMERGDLGSGAGESWTSDGECRVLRWPSLHS